MIRRVLFILLVFLPGATWLRSSHSIENFEEPSGPLYAGEYSPHDPASDGILKTVTYNIRYAEEIELAITELQDSVSLSEADVILLQEMDRAGTERVARELGLNYVYAPASIHDHHDREFGNAILSPWPLTDGGKLILPHKHPANDQMRTATRAIVHAEQMDILVYSAHTETILSLPSHRRDQFAAIAADVDPAADYVIVGGDFNTVSSGQTVVLAEQFSATGLEHATVGIGPTVSRFNVSAPTDHLFTRGFELVDVGVFDADASDHEPVWVRLRPLAGHSTSSDSGTP